jgi:hypothetical protein
LVSQFLESGICHVFGVAVLFNKAAPIGLELEYGILIGCNGKITTQYPVNQWIVVGELVASYFY